MIICIYHQNDGAEHCYSVPIVVVPVHLPPPGPNPYNYPFLMADAVIVGSLHALAQKISDEGARQAVHEGINDAVEAMQARVGKNARLMLNPQPLPP
jgi:hypothetical protein